MASALVPRRRAQVMLPDPLVVIQFICFDGPAWSTLPPEVAMNHPWLSARNTPLGSAVYIGPAGTLVRSPQLPVGDHHSPRFPPSKPHHRPPTLDAWPFH